ncbi:TPA: hypothetical protein ACQWFO_000488 [Neisseria subflava]|uniref:hypothetical protein n=1 Tax=unclassified Neisseria TaxID=2623750 RepID=UPI001CB04F73|nr:hypothetical protein [Neisseria sp.]MBF1301742.1 hypothetical protein [Neisseria sp.]
MSPKQILIVAIRLVALIGIVQTLGSIATIFVQTESMYDSKQISSVMMLYGVYLIAWLLLWCFPAAIANRLLPEHLQTVQEAPKHPAPWLTTGIVLIGIYTVFQVIPDLIYQFSLYLFVQSIAIDTHTSVWADLGAQNQAGILANIAQLFIGIFLLFGAPKLSSWIRKRL